MLAAALLVLAELPAASEDVAAGGSAGQRTLTGPMDTVPTAGRSAPAGCTAAHHSPELDAAVAAMSPDAVSVSAWNTDTGARVRCGATGGLVTASVIKLDVLETLLLQHQDAGTALSDDENTQATIMMENSDDDAATALWGRVGGAAGLSAANRRLGTSHLVPDPNGFWGLSTTSADDQLVLLHDLTTNGPLDEDSRQATLGLMRRVEADQRWGVGPIADPDTTPALKDGWLGIDSDSGRWAIGSVGVVTVHGQQLLVAVISAHNLDEGSGIASVQQLARAAADSVART